jgi:hypothetical protein
VSPAAASKALGRLVDAGLLNRTASPDDRRMQRLSVTGEGRRLLEAYEAEADEALDRLFGHLDPVGLRRLASSLDRLSLTVAERDDGSVDEACFRCGIYFRDRCLLRGASGNRTCYQHLGGGGVEVAPAAV